MIVQAQQIACRMLREGATPDHVFESAKRGLKKSVSDPVLRGELLRAVYQEIQRIEDAKSD